MPFREQLLDYARQNLAQNLVPTAAGEVLVAGSRQYRTLWVRDFCYSVPGLLRLGWVDLVNRQLRLIFEFRRPALPRGIDVRNVKLRVVMNTVGRAFPYAGSWEPGMPLVPEYLGEHGTPAYDSNLLFLLALAELKKHRPVDWIGPEEEQELLDHYLADHGSGLLLQPGFSDWQDSASRKGAVFLTHLLYLETLVRFPHLRGMVEEERVFRAFFEPETGMFREFPDRSVYCLDSHCFLLRLRHLFPSLERDRCLKALLNSPLWRAAGIPGIPTQPAFRSKEISWTTKLIGLPHYHHGLIWGWLSAEAYGLCRAFELKTEAQEILDPYLRQLKSDRIFWEVMVNKKGELAPFRTIFYASEGPFSWSAAKWVEAVAD